MQLSLPRRRHLRDLHIHPVRRQWLARRRPPVPGGLVELTAETLVGGIRMLAIAGLGDATGEQHKTRHENCHACFHAFFLV